MSYIVEKRYDTLGPCCFRQWRATSHCAQLHGYALSFVFTFEAHELNGNNWVVDFGDMRKLKERLEAQFDHTTVIAHDDPHLDLFRTLDEKGAIDLRVLDNVGCEMFAKVAYQFGVTHLEYLGATSRVTLLQVRCEENGRNSATYKAGSKVGYGG